MNDTIASAPRRGPLTAAWLDRRLDRARHCGTLLEMRELVAELRAQVSPVAGDTAVALFCEAANIGSEAARAELAELLGITEPAPAEQPAAALYNFGVDIGHGMEVAR